MSTAVRIGIELAAVVVLVVVGSLIGAATGVLALAPILGMALPLAAATAFVHREGRSWRDLGFPRRMPLGSCLGWAFGTAAAAIAVTSFVVTPLLRTFGLSPPDIRVLAEVIEGDTVTYLLFLIPVAWGSAAFGEELLVRGFVLDRFTTLAGSSRAVVLQAALFALGHTYQGVAGVVNLFVVGLILGYVCVRTGRNLWPVIIAHGLIDTLSLTLVYLGFAQAA